MRGPRIKEEGEAYYHMISRVVDRRMLFDTNEKERFRKVLRRVEAFCGLDILTYAILDNHFHLLIHVPARRDVPDPEFLERLAYLYDSTLVKTLVKELHQRRTEGQHEAAEALKAEFTYRMYDLSEFGKTLKQILALGQDLVAHLAPGCPVRCHVGILGEIRASERVCPYWGFPATG